jgi:2-hydroxy-3-keto-5-methylthiopentenyl-1-phosphate phosphatase
VGGQVPGSGRTGIPDGEIVPPRLVLDWDGTITEHDTLLMVLEEFGDWRECRRLGDLLFAGKISLREEIDRQFATVTAPLEEVVAWVLDNVRVRPGLPELIDRFHPLVVSSGLHELIDPVLAREGVEVELLANNAIPGPDGWRIVWRDAVLCTVCGQRCKRGTLPAGDGQLVYVGDGYSDRCAALAADRVFARRGLAAYLDEQGVAYEPCDDLHDVVGALSG